MDIIRQHIAEGELEEAIALLMTATQTNSHLHDELIRLSAHLAEISTASSTGTIDAEETAPKRAQVSATLLEIANEAEHTAPAAKSYSKHILFTGLLIMALIMAYNQYMQFRAKKDRESNPKVIEQPQHTK